MAALAVAAFVLLGASVGFVVRQPATRAVVSTTGARTVSASSIAPAFYSRSWLLAHPASALAPAPAVQAQSAVLVDLDRHQVLWERGPDAARAPASLTKMVTATVALDHASLDRVVTVPDGAANVEPDLMGLAAGDRVSVRDLLFGLFLDSGNDAAEALAQGLVPRARFIAEMNARAAAWGLRGTHFTNPSGLDDEGLHSTAYDLAVVAGHLTRDYPALLEIAGTRDRSIPATSAHGPYAPHNLNKLLWTYPGATGLKTGFTDDAGGCVAATATRNGRHLAVVVMNSNVFFSDAAALLDYGFSTAP